MRRELWAARAATVLGVIFLFAAWGKIKDPATFAELIYHYEVTPDWLSNFTAITLPWVELVAGLCLVTGVWQRPATLLTGGMLVMFMILVAQAMLRGLEIEDCGCFAGAAPRPLGQVLLEDALMLGLAVPAYLWHRRGRDRREQES